MNISELLLEANRDLVQTLVTLSKEEEHDESVYRRLFLQLGAISNDYVVVTRPGKSSLYAYFAKKGVRRSNKIGQDIDETMLEQKLVEGNLVLGVDVFMTAGHYKTFVDKVIVPATVAATSKLPPPVNDEIEHLLEHSDPEEEKECDVNSESDTAGDGQPQVPSNGGEKEDPPAKKMARLPKFQPVHVTLEERKFCFFHDVAELPIAAVSMPDLYDLKPKDVESLKIGCSGSALFGVVTPGHPLFGVPLVCANHKARRFYQFYGPIKCQPGFVSNQTPNLGQVCVQGGGGRPVLQEGKVQSNAQNIKRSRAKATHVKAKLVQSYEELCVEKMQLSLQVESNALQYETLKQERDVLLQNCDFLMQQNNLLQEQVKEIEKKRGELYTNCVQLYQNQQELTQQRDQQAVLLAAKDKEIQTLHDALRQARGF